MSHTPSAVSTTCSSSRILQSLFRVELPRRIDGDRLSNNSWKVVDLGRLLHAQVLREIRCEGVHEAFPEGAEVNGQSSAELGGHVSSVTLSAHQMAPAGVVPHSSSSELSAHQMLARVDLTSFSDRERTSARPHDVSAAPPPARERS